MDENTINIPQKSREYQLGYNDCKNDIEARGFHKVNEDVNRPRFIKKDTDFGQGYLAYLEYYRDNFRM